jgi:AcrR family transcriptional regulator
MATRVRRHQAHEATRRAILDVALALFVTDGYAQVSIRKIASKVGYSPGAIYSYFPSKDDIFLALAEEGFQKLGAAQLAMPVTADARADLVELVWRLYDFSREQPQYFALVFIDRHVPRIGRECERFAFMSEIKSHLLARVRRCVDEGLFPADLDPAVALRLLVLAVVGIASLRLSDRLGPGEDPDVLVRSAIATTMAGLSVGATAQALPSTLQSPRPLVRRRSSERGRSSQGARS